MNAQHSNKSYEWYTPPEIISLARELMGSIDLDPASSEAANLIVKAKRFWTKENSPLTCRWEAESVFLNPPGEVKGDKETKQYPKRFWEHLVINWSRSNVQQAVFVMFSVEQFATLQDCSLAPQDFPLLFLRNRIHFIGRGNNPSHSNALVWLPPPQMSKAQQEERLSRLARGFGRIMIPWEGN
jgi:hypothetical protein